MVFNATFKNISIISWWSGLLVEETKVPGENHWPVASHWQISSHNVVSSTPHHKFSLYSQHFKWEFLKTLNAFLLLCSILSTKMGPGWPNFVFGDQNFNLVVSVTTSIIEVGDQKFWIHFRHWIAFHRLLLWKSLAMNFPSMGLMFKNKSSYLFYFNSVSLSYACT